MTTIFTNQTPAGWQSDATAYALGTYFSSSEDGNITGGRFYIGGRQMDGKTVTVSLHQASGAVLKASKTKAVSAADPVGWVQVLFNSPVAITKDTNYIISHHCSDSAMYYSYTSGFFGSPLVNSPLTAAAVNGYLEVSGSPVMPTIGSGSNASFFADAIFELPAGGTMPTKNDTIFTALRGAGYTGTINDMERQRLLALLALTEPQNKSLQDLYKLAGERPRLP